MGVTRLTRQGQVLLAELKCREIIEIPQIIGIPQKQINM